MKKIIFILLGVFTLMSCDNLINKVEITNNSRAVVDSIIIYGNSKCEPLIIRNIKPKSIIKEKLENCNIPNGDGSYTVKIFTKKKVVEKGFGYFTNGIMYFKKVEIKYTNENNITITEFY